MAKGSSRPPVMPQGTDLGDHFRVEALVRLCETRMFYLVSDDRPDRPTRKCWDCGAEDNPRHARACGSCGEPFDPQTQFLMSVRWDVDRFPAAQAFHALGVSHPGILRADGQLRHGDALCSIVRYRNESLLLDEAAPLTPRQLIHMAQRFAGLLTFLHESGVALARVGRENILLRREENRLLLFDPDVAEVFPDGIVPPGQRAGELLTLGRLLERFTSVNLNRLRVFFAEAAQGRYMSPLEFGRAVEGVFAEAEQMRSLPGHAAMTDVGRARVLNEDNWSWTALTHETHLYVVADGMGGHDSGEVASAVASSTICDVARSHFEALDGEPTVAEMEAILHDAFQAANNQVKSTAEERCNDMGTTLVAALVRGRETLLANVGDSRGYVFRKGALKQLSKDHSLVARMVEQGRITAEEARTHPHSNILLRTVGTERDIDIDIFHYTLNPGDRILLNSDGLWGEVKDQDIVEIFSQYEDPRVCARELIRAANHSGGKDNITLMIASIAPDAEPSPSEA
ncbi:MAG: Stp1/IreP family PP2C-type Ser/Thr phosphatase [Alphaproteobacteria bacterium]|nr:Stp1/IreP family PP2C-type Ser/Thr phosphatase [Alphaproteobacteria bacterium]